MRALVVNEAVLSGTPEEILMRQSDDQQEPPKREPPKRCQNLAWNLGQYQLYANLYFNRIHNPPADTVHYDPEMSWTGSYLLKHPRESDAEWRERRAAAFHLPYPREIIRTYVDALFHQEVSHEAVETALGESGPAQFANIDGRSHTSRWWLKNKVCTLSELYGWVGVLTDMPADDGRPRTAYHRTDLPYSRAVAPTRLWDWRQDSLTGEFTYALIWESANRWRAWYPDRWELLDEHGQLLGSGRHTLGSVPLDICVAEPNESDDDLSPFGVSTLAGADRLALHVYQLCSLLDTHQRLALFSFLHIDKDPPKERQQAAEPDVVLGESHILWHRGEVGWVEPPRSVPEEAREEILWAIQEMRRGAGVSTWTEQIRERQSGAAIELSHSDRKRAVSRRGEELEDFENRFWRRRGELLGRPVPPDSVRYPRDYAVDPVEEELAEVRAIVDVFNGWASVSDELRPYLWLKLKRIIIRDVGHLEETAEILDSIEPLTEVAVAEDDIPSTAVTTAVDPDTALNGAQVASLLQVVQAVVDGQLPRASAVEIIVAAFPVSRMDADRILGDVGRGFVPTGEPASLPTQSLSADPGAAGDGSSVVGAPGDPSPVGTTMEGV